MLFWLPERIYNLVKDDPNYVSAVQVVDMEIWPKASDLVAFHNAQVSSNSLDSLAAMVDARLTKDEDKRLLAMINTDPNPANVDHFLNLFQKDPNVDNKLFAMCWALASYDDLLPEFFTGLEQFVKIFDQDQHKNELSERSYVNYFQFKIILASRTLGLRTPGHGLKMFGALKLFKALIDQTREMVFAAHNTDYVKDIVNHYAMSTSQGFIRGMFLGHSLGFTDAQMDELEQQVAQLRSDYAFKYSGYSLHELWHMYNLVEISIDRTDFARARKHLDAVKVQINAMFANKDETCHALTHQNLDLTEMFLMFVAVVNFIEKSVPMLATTTSLDKTNWTDDEKKVFEDNDFSVISRYTEQDAAHRSFLSRRQHVIEKFELK